MRISLDLFELLVVIFAIVAAAYFLAVILRPRSDEQKPSPRPSLSMTMIEIITLFSAVIAIIFGYRELRSSGERQQIDNAIKAIDNIRANIDEYTKAGLSILRTKNSDLIFKIVNAEPFQIAVADVKDRATPGLSRSAATKTQYASILDPSKDALGYFFLLDAKEVNGKKVFEMSAPNANKIRLSLVKYLNAWENLAILVAYGRAECQTTYREYLRAFLQDLQPAFEPFMIEYDKYYQSADQLRFDTNQGSRAWEGIDRLVLHAQQISQYGELNSASFCSKYDQTGWDYFSFSLTR